MFAAADEAAAAERGCAASSSNRDAARSNVHQGGRPTDVEIDASVLEWLCEEGYSNDRVARYFGTTVDAVKSKKRRLGLTKRRHVELPPLEVLQAVWEEDPRTSVAAVAAELGVSTSALRRHFSHLQRSSSSERWTEWRENAQWKDAHHVVRDHLACTNGTN